MTCCRASRLTRSLWLDTRCGVGPILLSWLMALQVGCTHTTLRRALDIDDATRLSVSVLERAAAQRFPQGTSIDVVERELPPSAPPPAWLLWWPFDLWVWEANAAHTTITIMSSHYYIWGAWWLAEIVLEFDDGKLARLTVRDAGRAL